jgi:hypothetical protein
VCSARGLGRTVALAASAACGTPTSPSSASFATRLVLEGGEGRGCDDVGRFVVAEARYTSSSTVERFRATFEHRCERFSDVLRGEVTLLAPPGAQASCP